MNKAREITNRRKDSVRKTSFHQDSLILKNTTDQDETEYSTNQSFFDPKSLTIKQMLGKGGYGCVYDATYKNRSVIVKSSLTKRKNDSIIKEYKHLKFLNEANIRGIPKVGHSFVYQWKQRFIMEKLGKDLNMLQYEVRKNEFSLEYTLRLAMKVLEIVKSVHSCGILHNDIKPENIMIGLNDTKTVYLIDFGIAEHYINDDKHISYETNKNNKCTPKYCSIGCHKGRSLSRRDDLESLAYTLIQLRTGKLPWDNILRNTKICYKEQTKLLVEAKSKPAEEIRGEKCKEFVFFLNEVRNQTFTEKPDYYKYYQMFRKILNERCS